jgi:hypothetical protein
MDRRAILRVGAILQDAALKPTAAAMAGMPRHRQLTTPGMLGRPGLRSNKAPQPVVPANTGRRDPLGGALSGISPESLPPDPGKANREHAKNRAKFAPPIRRRVPDNSEGWEGQKRATSGLAHCSKKALSLDYVCCAFARISRRRSKLSAGQTASSS